eukprot:755365_1
MKCATGHHIMYSVLFLLMVYCIQGTVSVYPKWTPTYQMNRSTIVMPCNYSGYMSKPETLARYGIVDFDWSNAKMLWANTSPMDCQERLLTQARVIKAINPDTKVFVYRNLAKALPWFTDVREKLMDSRYNKYWFLSFKAKGPYHVQPCTNTTVSKCSTFYHDQEQTPHYPAQCTPNQCDCGGGATNSDGLPCGEYVWDHRNASLREWLVQTHILGPIGGTGLNNDAIDGFYIDDGWRKGENCGQCNCDPYGGLTEEAANCTLDMGLTEKDVNDITAGWKDTMKSAQIAIVNAGGFNWQLFDAILSPDQSECTNWFRSVGKGLNETSLMHKYHTVHNPQSQFEVDLAIFLLVRGPYAWLGYGWIGCHSTWQYEWNSMLDEDYGEPKEPMIEIENGVFQREWSNCVVQMDCNTYTPSVTFV